MKNKFRQNIVIGEQWDIISVLIKKMKMFDL